MEKYVPFSQMIPMKNKALVGRLFGRFMTERLIMGLNWKGVGMDIRTHAYVSHFI